MRVEADTSAIRTANAAVLSASGLLGIVAAGAGVVTIIHTGWLGRVRRAVVQALDGISMTSRDGADAAAAPPLDGTTVKRRWLGG